VEDFAVMSVFENCLVDGAFFFYFRFAGRANTQLEIRGGDRQPITLRFE
jgi:hypothetical protein